MYICDRTKYIFPYILVKDNSPGRFYLKYLIPSSPPALKIQYLSLQQSDVKLILRIVTKNN